MASCANRPIQTDREDGRFMHTDVFLKHHYKTFRPKLEYKSGMTPEQYDAWREKVKEKLLEILRFPAPEDLPPQPAPVMLWEEARDGYKIQKWEAFPEPYAVIPFLVLVPRTPLPQFFARRELGTRRRRFATSPTIFATET